VGKSEAQHAEDLLFTIRFREKVEPAVPDDFLPEVRVDHAGREDDTGGRGSGDDAPQHLPPIISGQVTIVQDHGERTLAEQANGIGTGFDEYGFPSGLCSDRLKHVAVGARGSDGEQRYRGVRDGLRDQRR
jgi:hypothetical protein